MDMGNDVSVQTWGKAREADHTVHVHAHHLELGGNLPVLPVGEPGRTGTENLGNDAIPDIFAADRSEETHSIASGMMDVMEHGEGELGPSGADGN